MWVKVRSLEDHTEVVQGPRTTTITVVLLIFIWNSPLQCTQHDFNLEDCVCKREQDGDCYDTFQSTNSSYLSGGEMMDDVISFFKYILKFHNEYVLLYNKNN